MDVELATKASKILAQMAQISNEIKEINETWFSRTTLKISVYSNRGKSFEHYLPLRDNYVEEIVRNKIKELTIQLHCYNDKLKNLEDLK